MANPRPPKKKLLTIGMATYDDYDGVYFTVQALRLYHPEAMKDVEILVVDNNPGGAASQTLANLAEQVYCRYVAYDEAQGTAAPRNQVFREATTPWVMCVDSHVMFAPGVLRRFLDYATANPDSNDLLQGPVLRDDLMLMGTHFRPVWGEFMFGQWAIDVRGVNVDAPPFEIPMHGLGMFACRKEAWLGFNPAFLGFGGEEGYIHTKYRQAGRRVLCLPFLRWIHRFDRPKGTPYPNLLEDRLRNYLIGWEELGLDTAPVAQHFGEQLYREMKEAALSVDLPVEDDDAAP